MLYRLEKDQLAKLSNKPFLAEFYDAEMLIAIFKTDHNIARKILPKPLAPTKEPLATAFVAKYPETNFGCVYNEGALFLQCEYRGERGGYCLSMPVDDDMALIAGREQFGYPKKMADRITLEKDGANVIGSVIRKEVEILRIECTLESETPKDLIEHLGDATTDWDKRPCYRIISFLFKYFPSPRGGRFDYLPRLIREPILLREKGQTRSGKGEVTLKSTTFDPLADVPVGELVNIFYGIWQNTMLPGKVVARTWNPIKFAKHSFFKTDFAPTLLENFDPTLVSKGKQIMKAVKKY